MAQFKITKRFLKLIRHDLYHPHSFAFERVGFTYCRMEGAGGALLATDYVPISDDLYIEDKYVGARFSGEAIRLAMQRSMKNKEGVFHTHIHEHKGDPELSSVDIRSVIEISKALCEVSPGLLHGCVLLSENRCKVFIFDKVANKLVQIKTNEIGFPFSIFYPKGGLL